MRRQLTKGRGFGDQVCRSRLRGDRDHSADGGDKCGDYVKEKHRDFATAVDDGSINERYGIGGIPAYFIIDKAGAVAKVSTGGVPDKATIVKLLDAKD
jgi:hypothetical protein